MTSNTIPWDTFDVRTCWILRAAVGGEQSDSVSLKLLQAITPTAILAVPSVGPIRRKRAWDELQRLLGTSDRSLDHTEGMSLSWEKFYPPELTLGMASIPALPTDVAARDLVRLEDLDPSVARVIETLLIHMGCFSTDRLSIRWLARLDQQLLESIKSVGPSRAARFIKCIAEYEAAIARPSPSASALIEALEEASQETREALDAVVLSPELVPYEMRDLYKILTAGHALEGFSMQRMLTASASRLCDESGLTGPESVAFVRIRDKYFSHQLIVKAIRAQADPDVIKVAVLLGVAMRSELRWTSAVWENDAGVVSKVLVPLAKSLLNDAGISKPSDEWSYLEEIEMLDELIAGATLAKVGAGRGFTREYVRQRVLRLGYKQNDQKATNRERLVADEEKLRTDVERFARRHPGCTPQELSIAIGLSIERAAGECARLDWLTLPEANQTEPESATARTLQTAQRSLRALQDAATLVYPVAKADYDELRSKGFIQGPSSARMLQIFGSWRQACDDAGVESGKSPRRAGEHLKWSHTELMDVVIRYLLHPAFRGQAEQYRLWKESQPDNAELPSHGAIYNNLRIPWNRIKAKALKRARQKWKAENRSKLTTSSDS